MTANTTVRQLQDEVVQLRLREAQNREDLQRLTAENSRLKLKVLELRQGSLKPPLPTTAAATSSKTTASPKVVRPKVRAPSPGLSLLEDIAADEDGGMDEGVVHRGTMRMFARRSSASSTATSANAFQPISSSHRTHLRRRADHHKHKTNKPCPLCGRLADASDTTTATESTSSSGDDVTVTEYYVNQRRSTRGTSTREIENIVALRTSVNFLGFSIPIPLFVAILIRVIDNCLLMIGHICFAEYPPLHFPELRFKALQLLREVRARLHNNTAPAAYG